MATEIERKFLLAPGIDLPQERGTPVFMHQVYVAEGAAAVRVRITDENAWLTVKSSSAGMSRYEFECPMPLAEARQLARLPGTAGLTKTRYLVPHNGLNYEMDVYHGPLAGLVTVEVELPSEDYFFELPGWVGQEVTQDKRYSNEQLAKHGLPV